MRKFFLVKHNAWAVVEAETEVQAIANFDYDRIYMFNCFCWYGTPVEAETLGEAMKEFDKREDRIDLR